MFTLDQLRRYCDAKTVEEIEKKAEEERLEKTLSRLFERNKYMSEESIVNFFRKKQKEKQENVE